MFAKKCWRFVADVLPAAFLRVLTPTLSWQGVRKTGQEEEQEEGEDEEVEGPQGRHMVEHKVSVAVIFSRINASPWVDSPGCRTGASITLEWNNTSRRKCKFDPVVVILASTHRHNIRVRSTGSYNSSGVE